MNTLDKFLKATDYSRVNYPTKKELKDTMKLLKCTPSLKIDILTYFLY